jgi:hypothetical protein
VQLPESFLFALLMLPWAVEEIHLLGDSAGGGKKTNFSKETRDKVDRNLQHLNVKKTEREALTRLLINLPIFAGFAQDEKWPAWLTRKSYFNDCLLFFKTYQEAIGGPAVSEPATILPKPDATVATRPMPRSRHSSQSSRTPAFALNTKGGIFGLKKK